MLKNNTLIVYHADCIDGLASAWGLALTLPPESFSFLPYDHALSKNAEDSILDSDLKNIYFVDVAPSAEFLHALTEQQHIQLVTVIDHHIAALSLLQIKHKKIQLDIRADHPSAANMVWETLHSQEPKPFFIEMIGKMDIGFGLKTDDDFAAAAFIDMQDISSIDKAFATFERLKKTAAQDMINGGRAKDNAQKSYAEDIRKNISVLNLPMPDGTIIDVPALAIDRNKIGRRMSAFLRDIAQNHESHIALSWRTQSDGRIAASLRSDGTVDCNAIAQNIAQLFGVNGGGHASSAAINFASWSQFENSFKPKAAPEISKNNEIPPSIGL